MSGTLNGQLTIASQDDIDIVGQPRLPPVPRRHRRARSRRRQRRRRRTTRSAAGTTQPVRSRTRRSTPRSSRCNHSFYVQNWGTGAPLGTLTINGVITQEYRGPVGTFDPGPPVVASTGYNKNYTYDTRLKYLSPPYFLSPTQSAWGRISYAEFDARRPVAPLIGRESSSVGRRRSLACRACRRPRRRCVLRRACSTSCRRSLLVGPSSSRAFATRAERFGYGLLLTPIVEHYEVFQRVGETTDVVRKEMYDFVDRGGRRLALRPEGTAPVVRAFVAAPPARRRGRCGISPPTSGPNGRRRAGTASTGRSAPR